MLYHPTRPDPTQALDFFRVCKREASNSAYVQGIVKLRSVLHEWHIFWIICQVSQALAAREQAREARCMLDRGREWLPEYFLNMVKPRRGPRDAEWGFAEVLRGPETRYTAVGKDFARLRIEAESTGDGFRSDHDQR